MVMAGERDRERERGYQQSVGDLCQLVDGWREREREVTSSLWEISASLLMARERERAQQNRWSNVKE